MKFGQAHAVTTSLLAVFAMLALAGAVLGIAALFTIAFVALAIILPAGLVLRHLRREVVGNYRQGARDRTGMPVDVPRILRSKRVVGRGFFGAMLGLGAPMLAFTALFFVVLPRFHVGAWSLLWLERGDRVHVTDAVDLHGDGVLVRDPAVALRFTVVGAPAALPATMPMRFRGTVLDVFDGRRWRRTEESERVPEQEGSGRAIRIERASFDPPGMLVPEGTIGVSSLERTGETSMTYVAWIGAAQDGSQARGGPSTAARARALGIPKTLSPRLRALAHEWTEGAATDAEKAKAIEAHLKSYAYDLTSPARAAADPLDAFLFAEKRGHCELFASSMTVMLRAVGVPARMVTGLVGGTLNRFGGFYTVAQGDAHVWVEALVGDRWTTFDPTPTAPLSPPTGFAATANDLGDALMHRWAPNLLDFDATARAMLLSRPRVLVVSVVLLVALLVVRALLRLRLDGLAESLPRALRRRAASAPPRRSEAAAIYAALERVLEAHGIVREPSTPPLAHAEALLERGHPLADEILSLTRAYLEARFGARPLSPTEATSLRRRIDVIRQTLPS